MNSHDNKIAAKQLAKDIQGHLISSCLLLADEAVEGSEWAEVEPVNNSTLETANWIYNNPHWMVELMEGMVENCSDELQRMIFDELYKIAHPALQVGVLRLSKGDNTEYAIDKVNIDTTDIGLVQKAKPKRVKKESTKRERLADMPIVRAIRWMASVGFTKEEVERVCQKLLTNQPQPGTIQINMGMGRKGKDLQIPTTEQAQILRKAKEGGEE